MSLPIEDNEIRVIGQPGPERRGPRWVWVLAAAAVLAVVAGVGIHGCLSRSAATVGDSPVARQSESWLVAGADTTRPGIHHRTVDIDTTRLHIYLPIMATAELCLGEPDSTDGSILMAALAADLRRDNGHIVGAFVLHGEPLSWGLSKRGYCAILDGTANIGVADNTPLFEQATEVGGDFFRQYPAVDNGIAQENNPENSSFRRALCSLDGYTCLVCSEARMTMNDFAATLASLDVDNAIFLVGGEADGWYREADGKQVYLGRYANRKNRFLNYLVFRRQ